ncbi:MAG: hypothetical protein ACFE95_13105 [Candidatus Hodarchaeota archaeon]
MSIRRSVVICLRLSVIFLLITQVRFDAVIITKVYTKTEVTRNITQKSWSQTYGGDSSETCYSLVQTLDGGFALAGSTDSYSAGGDDMWLVKTDDKGGMQWNQSYGGPGWECAFSVIQTGDEGFALAGVTESYATGEADMWLVKTEKDGTAQWNQSYGGVNIAWAEALLQTPDGGFVIAGSTRSFGVVDIWLVKTLRYTPTIPSHVIFGVFLLGGLGVLILIILYYQRRKTQLQ